jgi:non-specific serine/threonine protein kinase
LIKRAYPTWIPKNIENELKDKANEKKVSILMNNQISSFTDASKEIEIKEIELKNNYKTFYLFNEEDRKINVSIKKAKVQKNGKISLLTNLNIFSLENIYTYLSEDDKKILDLITGTTQENRFFRSNISKNNFESLREMQIFELLKQVYLKDPSKFPNTVFSAELANFEFVFMERGNANSKRYSFNIFLKINKDLSILLEDIPIGISGKTNPWILISEDIMKHYWNEKKSLICQVNIKKNLFLEKILEIGSFEVPWSLIDKLLESKYLELSSLGKVIMPETKIISEISNIIPKIALYLRNFKDIYTIEPKFVYDSKEAGINSSQDIVFRDKSNQLTKINRNFNKESELFNIFLDSGVRNFEDVYIPINPLKWITNNCQDLLKYGFEIYGDDKLIFYKIIKDNPKMNINISSGIDWFDIDGEVTIQGKKLEFSKLIDGLSNNEKFIRFDENNILVIPKEWREKLEGVAGFLQKDESSGKYKALNSQIQIIESLLGLSEKFNVDKKYNEIKEKFKKFNGIRNVKVPETLNCKLREYQKAGYDWLHFLKDFSFGGILADDMGLGKTVQALSILLHEKESKSKNISLVVVPKSLVFNWQNEINKFAPSLEFYVHHGPLRKKNINKISGDTILTTYGTLKKDLEKFKSLEFNYIILDESQNIKNVFSQSYTAVLSLNGKNKLALSGTPIENNYLELWSQFNFVNPGIFGTIDNFKSKFLNGTSNKEALISLKNMINPFILIRKKEMVAKELPEKQITVLYCEMDNEQRLLYDSWKEKYRIEIKQSIENEGLYRSRYKIIEGLLRLRQICNHPKLVNARYRGLSEKFELIIKEIKEIISSGHKVLVFSSFVKMLKIFKEKLSKESIKFSYLDGKTRDREAEVVKFQSNDEIKVFLISIKAGGLGLNLTAADYVFIVDPWWNPAVEMQAIDRAHRIGQDKKVFVYKTITKDSVEEKILNLQEKKRDMVNQVIASEEGIFKKLTPENIYYLFN